MQTPEILENILIFLDERTLLTSALRVCRYWHDIISTSPSLQRHLFLQPDWNRKTRSTSTLLTEVFPLWFSPNSNASGNFQDDICIIDSGVQSGSEKATIFDTLPLSLPRKNEAFMRKNASWRRMLVQQPPIPCLVVFKISSATGGTHFRGPSINGILLDDLPTEATHMTSHNADPLRMGSFYDEIILTTGAIPSKWMIVWDDGQGNAPPLIENYHFDQHERRILEQALGKFGMILIVCQTKQYKKPFWWTPELPSACNKKQRVPRHLRP